MASTSETSFSPKWLGPSLQQRLQECGRDNNLNLIRMVAAMAVLVSHAVALTTGNPEAEPLVGLTGTSLGHFAVAVFFGISGLLIARSFDRRRTIAHFAVSRVLRLWPALLVVLLLTAFILGPLLTTQSAADYWSSPLTLAYVPSNLELFVRIDRLPGVFTDNPLPGVNGSLWSLSYEVLCYGGVVLFGFLGFVGSGWRMALLLAAAIAGNVLALIHEPAGGLLYRLDILGEIGFPFVVGMAMYVWRNRIPLGPVGAATLWGIAILFHESFVFSSLIMVALVYTTFWVAFLTPGWLLTYNRLGDYSYGTYIYAFPVQQTLIALWPGMDATTNVLLAAPLTLVFAVLSWKLVEKRALAMAGPAGSRLAAIVSLPDRPRPAA